MVNAPIGPPVEKETIEQAIASCDGNIPKAALLEISPPNPPIYRKKQSWEEASLV
ncbi:helix-turn-helix domain-containing protein [Aeromonas bestiarum]|uniref:helix-turn-helix domain-containing protein n=1 Tax=Aeromonas bestiarum TaxID=105751 RepID=UPI003B75B80A